MVVLVVLVGAQLLTLNLAEEGDDSNDEDDDFEDALEELPS